jgi:thymidine kinase
LIEEVKIVYMAKENLTDKKGNLTIIAGPMFAGKTKELLRQIHLVQEDQKEILIFKSFLDTLPSTETTAHSNKKTIAINKSKEINECLKKYPRAETIFIDGLHFFDRGIVKTLNKLVKKGYLVVAAGLDQDFRGKPFENTAFLLALAEKVIKLASVCRICRQEARMTQRLINGQPVLTNDPIILVGGKEIYEPRCRIHHVISKLETAIGEKVD